MKKCDVCNSSLGLMKFHYAEGIICKSCYKAASKNYTETINKKTYAEIKKLIHSKNQNEIHNEEFEVTKKIGNYILFDEKNQKFCIPNNRMVAKEYQEPEIYDYEDIKKCELLCDPVMSIEDLLKSQSSDKNGQVIKSLGVRIHFQSNRKAKEIRIITTPVRIKSFAFKRSFAFAKRIVVEFPKNHNVTNGKPA